MRDSEQVRNLVEEMDPDDRARLIDEVPAGVARQLMAGISADEQEMTRRLLGYPDESAGRIMSPEFVHLRAPDTVDAAMARVRAQGADAETIYALPVTDEEWHLVGVVSLRDLILADAEQRVGQLMTSDVIRVRVDTDQEVAARLMQEADLIALPVVDFEDRLVGVITVDDAMEILEEEESEDIARGGGSNPLDRPYLANPVWRVVRARLPWLAILMVPATLTAVVLAGFEDTLESVAKLAWFVPLLIGTGGNAGSQAATTVVRALALGEVRFRDLPRVAGREILTGALIGLGLGVVTFFVAWALFDVDLAWVLAIALALIVTWATLVAALLPLLAKRFGADPALVSTPFATVIIDATALVIYLGIAQLILEI
jgi:magnesium transporter